MLTVNPLLLFVNPEIGQLRSSRSSSTTCARGGKSRLRVGGQTARRSPVGELLKLTRDQHGARALQGRPARVNDVLGGRVGVMLAAAPTVAAAHPLGKAARHRHDRGQRSAFAPEIPTIAESGFPGFDVVI